MKNKKTWFKILFVIVLILIILYTFRDSADEIVAQLRQTSLKILFMIALSSVIYHLFEGWILYSLARRFSKQIKYREAVYCAFNCSFYRLSTLGSAPAVAAVVYLGKKGVGYSEATGLYTVTYMLHKVSIALLSAICFLVNWRVMSTHYRSYAVYLILAYILTALISVGLVLFCVSTKFHQLLLWLGKKVNRSHKLDGLLAKLEASGKIMEESTSAVFKDVKLVISIIIRNILKFGFWYCIPFLIMFGTGELSLLNSLSVTSLSVMTAAVIPTPAGIGSTELIMSGLLSVFVDVHKAAAITLLYRVATFIFPFVVGGVLLVLGRIVKHFRWK